jgi:Flp pilus assembly protein TadG
MIYQRKTRKAAAMVEFALVAPAFFLFIMGLVIGGLGVFRYQQVAWLAREGTRYAAVHGTRSEMSTGVRAASAQDIRNHILSQSNSLDPSKLEINVIWTPDNSQKGAVEVTVLYHWLPEAYLGGIDLTSKARMPMQF